MFRQRATSSSKAPASRITPGPASQLTDEGESRGQLRIIDEGGRVLVGRGREHEGLASRPAGRDAGPLEAKPEKEQSSKAFSVFALRFVRVRHDTHSRKRIRSIALGDERREGPKGRRGAGGFNRTGKGCFGESGEGFEVKACGHVAVRS